MTPVTKFTIDQIKKEHVKVKSGADFPKFIASIRQLGVSHYDTYVTDGHTDYYDENNHHACTPAKYEPLSVATIADPEQFKTDLKAHQNGQTDYLTFCTDCAKSGIERWAVYIEEMTCTYYDTAGNNILIERIPL